MNDLLILLAVDGLVRADSVLMLRQAQLNDRD